MSDASDPLDPKEATEAKLCAYLEGELQPSERAEIEQHLAANPQHRHLLGDLAKTRDWMRSIPTESSPTDLAEIFQGQVERSMLLDDATGSGRSSLNRWPQMLLVAALVLLVLGLGVMLVEVLRPPGSGKNFSLIKSSSEPATQSLENSLLRKTVVTDAIPAIGVSVPTTEAVVAEIHPAVSAATATKTLPLLPGDAPAGPSIDSVKIMLLNCGYHLPADQNTVCFVVSTDSTTSTFSQIRGFFGRHELAFDDALTGKHLSPAEALDQSMLATTAPTSAPSQAIYVSQGLTPLQLELLSASLATDNLNQTFKRFTLIEPPATQPIQPVVGQIVKGQMLSITIPQLVGPGVDKTNLIKVGDDGTIIPPMLDPLPAAGLQTSELEQRIAAKYREANLIPQATVTVQISAATQPSTLPSTQPTAKPLATTQPATLPSAGVVSVSGGISVVVWIKNPTMPVGR